MPGCHSLQFDSAVLETAKTVSSRSLSVLSAAQPLQDHCSKATGLAIRVKDMDRESGTHFEFHIDPGPDLIGIEFLDFHIRGLIAIGRDLQGEVHVRPDAVQAKRSVLVRNRGRVRATDANDATDTMPAVSPDGKWLAYAAMKRPGYESDRLVLTLRNIATGEPRALTAAEWADVRNVGQR